MLEQRILRIVDTLWLAILMIVRRCVRLSAVRHWTDRQIAQIDPQALVRLMVSGGELRQAARNPAQGLPAFAYAPVRVDRTDESPHDGR
jgi:hypothetical protein